MADDAAREIERIETLLLLPAQSPAAASSSAYFSLIHFQERFADDPLAIQALADRSHRILPLICSGASLDDEEISSLALKCLGFMIYHPSLVSTIPDDLADSIVECLVKLITTTKVKAICNLGVWCISIQQFSTSFLATHLHSLLRGLMHALDNPFGSLSTTFEAIQAVMKLVNQLREKMREMSNFWGPPLYRRLLSNDKRERDMSGRCFLRIKSVIFPPTEALSKAVAVDLKKKLIPGMKDMIKVGQKRVHVIQAWGWYIRLLGPKAVENRRLVNEMLKIPELTFSDPDPQVQIATQVAWECLVDALMPLPSHIMGSNATQRHGIDENKLSPLHIENQAVYLSKRIKLIMTPILGVISSKCDMSVRSSCFSTWCYLLHKLDHSVNHASVVKTVLEPIFEVIFQLGPENNSIQMWNACLDILDEFISSKTKIRNNNLNSQVSSSNPPTKTTFFKPSICKETLKNYPIKWLPWDLCQLDFSLKMLQLLITKGLTTSSLESRKLVFCASLRIFISILKAVQVEFTMTSNGFSRILLCLASILRFVRWTSEEMISKFIVVRIHDLPSIATQFVETVREELQPSMLASPLYKIPLDLRYIDGLHSVENLEYPVASGFSFVDYMTPVSPMAYLTTIYLLVIVQSALHLPKAEWIPYTMQYSKFIFSSIDPSENLLATISLLHMLGQKLMQGEYFWLKIWKVVSEDLIAHMDAAGNLHRLQTEPDSTGHIIMRWFLCYPFVIFYPFRRLSILAMTSSHEMDLVLSERELERELVVDTWKSLHNSANYASQLRFSERNKFSGGLSDMLIRMFGENINNPQCVAASIFKEKEINSDFLLIFGEAVINILKWIQVSDVEVIQSRENFTSDQEGNNCKEYNNVKHMLKFVARFLSLSMTMTKTDIEAGMPVVSRVFAAMASFVGRLFLRQDLLLFMEVCKSSYILIQGAEYRQTFYEFPDLASKSSNHAFSYYIDFSGFCLTFCVQRSFDYVLAYSHRPQQGMVK